ncbi:endothelin-converting enzyme 1-like [Halichondria panicea]|uniref:endothelin-converting enzyme 1-like n=1 Tax=Halichondria panicea TaxID=6063 RepID=UPI00312B79BD
MVVDNISRVPSKSGWMPTPGWTPCTTKEKAYPDHLFDDTYTSTGSTKIYSTYGALGVVVGHELTHGFDDQVPYCITYTLALYHRLIKCPPPQVSGCDKDRILEPWSSSDSVKAFDERKECFVEQYSKYEVFGYQINGSLTLGENITDNGGIKSAFQAHKDGCKEPAQGAVSTWAHQVHPRAKVVH